MGAPTLNGINRFQRAVLANGDVLFDVKLTRCTGYDTAVWITDGTTFAPSTQVVTLDTYASPHGRT